MFTVLKRVYGKEALSAHNYSTVLSSLGFAGTVVGMLIFGAIRRFLVDLPLKLNVHYRRLSLR